ncbi:MAG: hypothetical protein JO061_24515 [Acidobacteriaceae bacterium]|nr:hypothetical protein [Acidobacteriaceae bacterium]
MLSEQAAEAADPGRVPRYKSLIPKRWLEMIAPVWILCLILGSFLPGPTKQRLGTLNPEAHHHIIHVIWRHRIAHLVAFGSTALLLMMLADTRRGEFSAATSVFLLGLLIECVQPVVYGTVFEYWDLRDDFYAVSAAFAGVQIARDYRSGP